MLKLRPSEIESYLREKNLTFRRRGAKAEVKVCPFCSGGEHKDKYTFVVYLDESGGNFKCMRGKCDESGTFWALAEKFGDDPKEFYERDFTPEKETGIVAELKPVLSFETQKVEPQKLTEAATAYLTKRGFTSDVLEEMPIWCDEKGLINFGYYHEGELCMVKVRQPRKPVEKEPKAWQKWSGGLRTLYGLELCDFSAPFVVITFGEYDAIACRQARISNVVSVPCGDGDLEWINVCYEQLKELKEIYLWLDNDEAGRKALAKIAARLGERKIKLVDTNYKDANEMLLRESLKNGQEAAEEAVFNAVNQAKWLYKGDVLQFADIPEKEVNFEGVRTGLDVLDKNLGGSLYGRVILLTGSNKAGKSVLVNQLTAEAIENGTVACVYAGEDEITTYKYNMQVHVGGYEAGNLRESRTGAEYVEIKPEYKTKINDWAFNRLFVISRKSGLSEDTIIENFRLAFERFGCDFFVVDNLMKLVASKDTQNVNFRQTQVMNRLTDFAAETGAVIYVIAHTNKTDDERSPPKTSREVAGAKEIVNLCDAAINIFRVPDDLKSDYENCDAVISIMENRVFGIKESANLIYDWRIRRYAETQEQLIKTAYKI
jgi:archaellum biogenesis ATPase FlaH